MSKVSQWVVASAWAVATAIACWTIGDVPTATILALGSAVFLWLFLALWHGSTLKGALITFGVPGLMVVAGALLFGMGHRGVGNTLMIGSAVAFGLLAYWVFARWGNGAYVGGFGPDDMDSAFHANEGWLPHGWGRGKAVPDLPACRTSDAIWPFAEFGAINPNAGREDR